MTLVTKSITFFTAAMTGSAAEIIPFTRALIYVIRYSNTGCRAFNILKKASLTCCRIGFILVHISEKAFLIFASALSTFSRNSSFVLYKAMNPAARAATAAMAIPTGPVSTVSTLAMPPPAPSAPFSFAATPTTLDIPVDSFPKTSSAGPTAATTAAIFRIVCFWLSDRFLNHCANSFTFSTAFVIIGCSDDKIAVPRSAAASFRLLVAILASSHGS